MKPVCFMVMPFQRKPVAAAGEGAPSTVDCDRLWDVVFRPLLAELGYVPVRADIESSSVIIKDMLNRLKHADLVLADVSLPNGNVYYELGIRHVAKTTRCVQVAASWFKPLFDIQQFRTITYPLSNGDVPDAEAEVIRAHLKAKIADYCDGKTPYHELVTERAEQAFDDDARRISAFQEEISAVRLMPNGHARAVAVRELAQKHGEAAKILPSVALELLSLLRDTAHWQAVRDFVESLPAATREVEVIQEQYFLALSALGEHERAIAGVLALIKRFGATQERCGLVGGRYKRLFWQARKQREAEQSTEPSLDERQYLKSAIEYYEKGMLLDLNEYYCACNLPALLRARNKRGDDERARAIDVQVVAACVRAKQVGSKDPFLNNTLFGTAFRQGNVAALEDITEEIEADTAWELGTTLEDAKDWIRQAPEESRAELSGIVERLRAALAQKQ